MSCHSVDTNTGTDWSAAQQAANQDKGIDAPQAQDAYGDPDEIASSTPAEQDNEITSAGADPTSVPGTNSSAGAQGPAWDKSYGPIGEVTKAPPTGMEKFVPMFEKVSKETGVPANVLMDKAWEENRAAFELANGDPSKLAELSRPNGGLMQLDNNTYGVLQKMHSNLPQFGSSPSLAQVEGMSVEDNLRAGAWYLQDLRSGQYDIQDKGYGQARSEEQALLAYKRGSNAA